MPQFIRNSKDRAVLAADLEQGSNGRLAQQPCHGAAHVCVHSSALRQGRLHMGCDIWFDIHHTLWKRP